MLRNNGAFEDVSELDWNEGEISLTILLTFYNVVLSTSSAAVYHAHELLDRW